MKDKENIIVGISIGDLNGIGGEIVLKTFKDFRMLTYCTPVIFASIQTITFLKTHFKFNLRLNSINKLEDIVLGEINVFNVWTEDVFIEFGKEDNIIGEFAIKSLQAATQALKEDQIDILVTAPINKHNIQSEGFNFPGHTNYLEQELEGRSLMFMVTETLKVGLLTDHIPIKNIAKTITPELIEEKINIVDNTLKQDFKIKKPKIAILSINPHVGDHGVIGKDDDEVLIPTIEKIKSKGLSVFGPFAADSFFGSKNYKDYDAIIASYHDQGLIPFKLLSFGNGVNFTAGLNKVRTSPDHGTAFEIAGKNIANENSFKEAVFMAIKAYRNRFE